MTRLTYSPESPYSVTPQTSWYIDPLVFRDVPVHIDDRELVLEHKYKHKPWLLSYDLYGTAKFWWVFAVRNPHIIVDPLWDMEPGVVIAVPSKTHLQRVLGGV